MTNFHRILVIYYFLLYFHWKARLFLQYLWSYLPRGFPFAITRSNKTNYLSAFWLLPLEYCIVFFRKYAWSCTPACRNRSMLSQFPIHVSMFNVQQGIEWIGKKISLQFSNVFHFYPFEFRYVFSFYLYFIAKRIFFSQKWKNLRKICLLTLLNLNYRIFHCWWKLHFIKINKNTWTKLERTN